MLQNWLKIYKAHQVKNKVYFILTILGLAIGLWGVLVAYLYYKEEVRYDQWNPYKDEVYLVSADLGDGDIWMLAPYPVGSALSEGQQSIDSYMYLSNYQNGSLEVEGEKKFFEKGLVVQANFLDFFPFPWVEGTNALDKPNSVLVLDTYAKQLFGAEAIGKKIRYQGEWYTVEGIYSFGDTRSSIAPNMLFSGLEKTIASNQNNWSNYNASLYLKIKDAASLEEVTSYMSNLMYENVYARLAKGEGKTVEEYLADEGESVEHFRLFPLSGQHMIADQAYNGTLEQPINMSRLYILIGLSVTILLLSVVNYINLSIVQSLKRHREMGIRLVVGSTNKTLFGQLFVENSITLCLALGVSFVFIELSLPFLRVFLASSLIFNLGQAMQLGVVFVVVLASVVAALLLVIMRRVSTLSLLKGYLLKTKKQFGLRSVMLGIQFVIASFFIIGTTVVYQQVSYMLDKDLGFNKEQVLILPFFTAKRGAERASLYQTYKEELHQIPGINNIGSTSLPLGGYGYNSSSISHQGTSVQIMNVGTDGEFLSMLGIKIVEGRALDSRFASDTISNIMINQKLKDKFGDPDIVGKQLNWNNNAFTVVGIVSNYHTAGFKTDYEPMLFFCMQTVPGLYENIQELYVRFDPKQTQQILGSIEQTYEKLNVSDYPFAYEFLDQRFKTIFNKTIQERNILLVLSSMVVFIALFGLYSVVSFNLSNQYKAIAIRKVLGASNQEQLRQLIKQYVLIGFLGFGLALYPSYYFLNAWLSDYVFRIEISWINFVVAFLFLMLLTLLVLILKVRQVLQMNVVQHIKYE
ncbi:MULTISPECIES: ABC transporter permease [unclassified Myroides]|uniref:ABC transporter permease n=1 Tax=unclassified Myroides TaxID=2642485 RepID=UPI003D2F8CFB